MYVCTYIYVHCMLSGQTPLSLIGLGRRDPHARTHTCTRTNRRRAGLASSGKGRQERPSGISVRFYGVLKTLNNDVKSYM